MPKSFRDVTDAELAILSVLWDRGPSTIREIAEVLYPRCGASDQATVHKLLARICEKGCARREKGPGAQTFVATVDRDSLIGKRLEGVAKDLCDGSMTPLLTHLMKSQAGSPKQREALRRLVDDLTRRNKGKS